MANNQQMDNVLVFIQETCIIVNMVRICIRNESRGRISRGKVGDRAGLVLLSTTYRKETGVYSCCIHNPNSRTYKIKSALYGQNYIRSHRTITSLSAF